MKVLVTGGAGFVGSHLVEYLISKNHFPIIVDNLSSGSYENIKKFVNSRKAKFIKMDIRDFKSVNKLPKTDAIIHLAAIASVIESINNPIFVNDVNVNGTLNILELCRKKKIKKLVFMSSAAIFGDYEKSIIESTEAVPTTVYGSTKLTGEQYCKIYSDLFGVNIVILRPFNIYGLRQNETYAGVISKFMIRLKQNKPFIIFGDGKQTRDFIHVLDVVNAIVKSLSYNTRYDAFNLATGKSTSINQLASIFLKFSKTNKKPIYKKAIPGVVIHNSTRINKIRNILGFNPKMSLEEGIKQLISD